MNTPLHPAAAPEDSPGLTARLFDYVLLAALLALLLACTAQATVDEDTPQVPTPTHTPVPAETEPTPTQEDPTAIPPTPVPTPTAVPTLLPPSVTPIPPAPTVPVVSNEVPSKQELLDLNLTEEQAECFIATIDPDGTGQVQSSELFIEALGTCT